MPNETNNEIEPLLDPKMDAKNISQNAEVEAQKKRATRRVKPTLEGINSSNGTTEIKTPETKDPEIKSPEVKTPEVKTTPSPRLTPQEKEIIANPENPKKIEPRLMPQSVMTRVSRPSHTFRNIVVSLVILLFIGLTVYIFSPQVFSLFGSKSSSSNSNTQQANNGYAINQPIPLATSTITDQDATAPSGTMVSDQTGSSTPLTTATGTPVTATPTPTTTLTVNNTPTGYLNVRPTPSTAQPQITQIHPGETYPYMAKQNGWYEIILPTGQTGWVSGQYVTVGK